MTNENEAFTPGEWYLFAAPGGFTLIGRYVRPMGMGAHRFAHVTHFRNAGDMTLAEICAKGPGPKTKLIDEFPGYWTGTPIWWTDYDAGKFPWVEAKDRRKLEEEAKGG